MRFRILVVFSLVTLLPLSSRAADTTSSLSCPAVPPILSYHIDADGTWWPGRTLKDMTGYKGLSETDSAKKLAKDLCQNKMDSQTKPSVASNVTSEQQCEAVYGCVNLAWLNTSQDCRVSECEFHGWCDQFDCYVEIIYYGPDGMPTTPPKDPYFPKYPGMDCKLSGGKCVGYEGKVPVRKLRSNFGDGVVCHADGGYSVGQTCDGEAVISDVLSVFTVQ